MLRLKKAPRLAERSTCRLMHECSVFALTAVKLELVQGVSIQADADPVGRN
jgi:hypothetical protein